MWIVSSLRLIGVFLSSLNIVSPFENPFARPSTPPQYFFPTAAAQSQLKAATAAVKEPKGGRRPDRGSNPGEVDPNRSPRRVLLCPEPVEYGPFEAKVDDELVHGRRKHALEGGLPGWCEVALRVEHSRPRRRVELLT